MMRAARVSDDLLMDSEASLRMANGLLDELLGRPAASAVQDRSACAETPPLAAMPEVLLRAYEEITDMLPSLRQCRSVLERTTVARLQRTQQKLRDVSSVTEMAASDMLDGLDRALVLLDQLEADAGAAASSGPGNVHQCMRDELHQLVSCLQFEDITFQQLGYASDLLEDMATRMSELAALLYATSSDVLAELLDAPLPPTRQFDPAASSQHADRRQAVADESFLFGPANVEQPGQ